MPFVISRPYNGTIATALPARTIGNEAHKTFEYAVRAFGYLVERNETISLEEWRWRIAKHCAPSDRIVAALQAIDKARGKT